MKIIGKLFGSKKRELQSERTCLNWLCVPMKFKENTGSTCESSKTTMLKLRATSMSSKVGLQIAVPLILADLKPNFITYNIHAIAKEDELFLEDDTLIGLINSDKKKHCYFKDYCEILEIGNGKELNYLRSLRPFSFSKIIVIFNEFGCQFSIEQLVISNQRLLFRFQNQLIFQKIAAEWQNQLILQYGDQPLSRCSQKMNFQISQSEKYIWIYAYDDNKKFKKSFFEFITKVINYEPSSELIDFLLKKVTLSQYLSIKQQKINKKTSKDIIQNYCQEFQQISKQVIDVKRVDVSSIKLSSNQRKSQDQFEYHERKSNSDNYVIYFQQKNNLLSSHQTLEKDPLNIQIQDIFPTEDDVIVSNDHTSYTVHKVEYNRIPGRCRSKSEDAPCEYDTKIDDQLFDKYQSKYI